MDDILSQIIAYAPNKIDTEVKARAMVQGPRNMYAGGQLVSNTVDGSRPGYSGRDRYSELAGTSVEDLKKLGFTGVKGTKKGNPGGYYKFTEEFKEWVRKKTQEDPGYGKKELKDQPGRKRVYNLIIKAIKNKNPGYILEKGIQNKTKTNFQEQDYLTIEKIENDPLVRKQFKEYSGLKDNQINKIFKDRETLKTKQQSARGEINQALDPKAVQKKDFYKKAEKWILRNSKTYVDPENFYNAFVKKFGKDNHLVQAIEGKLTTISNPKLKSLRGMVKTNFSDDFMAEVLGAKASKKGSRASIPIENLKDLFRTTIYTNNPDVRQRILDTFTDIIPEKLPGKTGLLELRDRLRTDPILKKYNLNGAIRGPIAKLLANDLNQITLEDIASFKRPIVGTTDILRFLGTRVDPKYKSMFEEATKAITYAQQNQWPLAKKAINSSQAIQFDHKIPTSLINEGFADDIDYIKVTPTSKKFNVKVKNMSFDMPMKRLANEFKLKTTTLDRKAEIFEEMKFLRDDFNKKYGNYLDSVKIDFNKKTGDIKLTNIDKPVTKKTDLISSFADSLKKEGKVSEKKLKTLLKQFEAHPGGCGKAAGGRILFAEGTPNGKITKCARRGVQAFIDDLKKGNYSKATVNILKGGGNVLKNILDPKELLKLRNYFGPVALGFMAAFEGGVITDDVVRQGTPLNESLANNWLTKSFLPYTKDYAQAKNLLETGNVPSNMKKYVTDVIDFNEALKDIQGIENRVSSRLVDQGGYGMGDGSSMYSQKQQDKEDAAVMKKLSNITDYNFLSGSAKDLEYKKMLDEMEATRMAKKEFSPIFGFDKLKDVRTLPDTGIQDYLLDEKPKDLRPITYMDAKYEDVKTLPSAERKMYEDYFTKQGILQPRQSLSELKYGDSNVYDEVLKDYNKFQRQEEASKYPGYYGTQDKFMEGGIASLNVNKK